MTLEQATNRVTRALEDQDLSALEIALEARQSAIQCGDAPTEEIIEAGRRAECALTAWKKRLAFDSARLGQVRSYLNR
jgi:hypothetical protein